MFRFMMCLAMAILGGGILAMSGDSQALGQDKKADSYIKVQARGKLETGIMAIGGETTGTLLRTKDGTLELDLAKNKLGDAAEKLNGKDVIVTGTLSIRKGVEIPQRLIVVVETIVAGDK